MGQCLSQKREKMILDRYSFNTTAIIGQGFDATVYQGYDTLKQGVVAIKVVNFTNRGNNVGDIVKRFDTVSLGRIVRMIIASTTVAIMISC